MSHTVLSLAKHTSEAPPEPPARAEPQPAPAEPALRRARRRAHAVVTHDRTRFVLRQAMYVGGGLAFTARRTWDSRSAARYERMIRAAEIAGRWDEAKEWEGRGRQFRAARHQRRMDLINSPVRLAKGAVWTAGLGTGTLLALGIAMAIYNRDLADVVAPIQAVLELIHWATVVVAVVWWPAVLASPFATLAYLWHAGRKHQTAPQWMLPVKQRSLDDEPITPSIVVKAFRDLGIAQLRKALLAMEDAGASLLGPIRLAGCGVEVDVALPSGVSTEEILGRRRKVAENLNRHEHEVFITIPPQPRTVRLWIADSGALDEPIGPSPLLLDEETAADYYTGSAPWGQNLRGDAVGVSVFQRHILLTGLSNQGKTASLRALALWLALDSTVDFRIADLKGVGDWRMFLDLASILIQGPTDEHVMEATHMVEGGVDEMQRRIELLEQSGATDGVTRDMARTDPRFRPIVFIVDEAQVAYGCGAKGPDNRPYGGSKATSRYFQAVKKIHDQGRAVNVTIWEGTQDPTDENLPKRSREGNHIRGSLVLGTESQAKMALGEAPVDAGAAPHKLRRGLDRGTLVVAGEGIKMDAGQSSVTVRTHFISGKDAAVVTDRAKARRNGVTTLSVVEAPEEVDVLADVLAVLGTEPRVRTQEVLQGLAQRNPGQYKGWTFGDLTGVLEEAGAAPYKSEGVMVVALKRVEDALAAREEAAGE
ncbi:FtsK/SpoIIIE domain-containing protein [Streptomyces sp. NPDC088732]|uniref:FtsK/SpoIIIE domain-containing protein n=1 Tax=Streptomyces sp. NPDC088732 TaxID=3365879 RepID=UPI0037F3E78C